MVLTGLLLSLTDLLDGCASAPRSTAVDPLDVVLQAAVFLEDSTTELAENLLLVMKQLPVLLKVPLAGEGSPTLRTRKDCWLACQQVIHLRLSLKMPLCHCPITRESLLRRLKGEMMRLMS